MCSFAQQPNQSLHFLNAKPEWSHISFYNAFSDPKTIPRLVKDPIISDSAIYLVTDLCYSHCYGYGIEKLDTRSEKELWKDYYSFVMVNHKGELLDRIDEVLTTPWSDCIALPIGKENKLMVLNSELNKKAIKVFSGVNKLEKTLKLSNAAYLYAAYPMPNNQIMLDLVYFDTLTNKETNYVKQFSLLNLAEFGYITKVKNPWLQTKSRELCFFVSLLNRLHITAIII